MPKPSFPATGEAMPAAKINRRAVLTCTVATAAALAATPLPADAAESPVVALIEAHKVANAEWLKTVQAEDEASSVAMDQDRDDPILAEVFPGHHQEIHNSTDLGHEVARLHEEARQKIVKSRVLSEDIRSAALADIDRAELEARKRCAASLRRWKARRKANGYEAANRAYHVAREADRQAAWAVVEHPCRTMEENRIRAEYLLQETRDAPGKDLRYSMEADADMLEAFIRSTAGMEALS